MSGKAESSGLSPYRNQYAIEPASPALAAENAEPTPLGGAQEIGACLRVARASLVFARVVNWQTWLGDDLAASGIEKMSDVAERVKKIVVEHLGVDADKVVESANFIDDLGADSLDTVELVMAFEEEFGVEIPDDQAETITTVGDAVKFLEKASASAK